MTLKKTAQWLLATMIFGSMAGMAAASPESDAVKAAGTSQKLKLITVTIPANWTKGGSNADTPRFAAFADPELTGKKNCFEVNVESRYAASEKALLKALAKEAEQSKKSGAEPVGIERVTVAGAPAYALVTKTFDKRKDANEFFSCVTIAGEWPYGRPVGSQVGTFKITFNRSKLLPGQSFKEAFEKGEADPALQAVLETLQFNDANVNKWFEDKRARIKADDDRKAAVAAKLKELAAADSPEEAVKGEWKAENGPTLVFNEDGSLIVKGAWKIENDTAAFVPLGTLSFVDGVIEATAADGAKTVFTKQNAAAGAASAAAAETSNDPAMGTWKLTGAMLRSQPMDAAKAAYYFPEQAVTVQLLGNGLVKTGSTEAGVWEKDGENYKIEVIKGAFAGLAMDVKDGQLLVRRSPVVTMVYGK